MKDLKELTEIVIKHREKKIEVLQSLDATSKKSNKFIDVCQAIIKGDLLDDVRASTYLNYKLGSEAYRFFKYRLRKLLLNSLFFIEFKGNEHSEYARAEYGCSVMRHQIYVLGAFGARETAIKLCKTLMTKAERYSLAEYMTYSLLLLSRYAAITGPKVLFVEYNLMLDKWSRIENAEKEARVFLNKINIEFVASSAPKPEFASLVFQFAKKVKKYITSYPTSFILKYHWYWLQGYGFEINGEYNNSLKIWQELEHFIRSQPLFVSNTRLGLAAQQQMVNFLNLKDYTNGKICALRCSIYFRKGSNNWLIFLESHFLLCMRSGDISSSIDIFNMVVKDIRLTNMPDLSREKWILYLAYLHYIKLVSRFPLQNLISNFNIRKFLNEFQIINKDKRGYNLEILVIHICILIHERKQFELINIMESVKVYRNRYLKKDEDYRIQIFLQLLLKCEELNYDYEVIQSKTTILFDKLVSASTITKISYESLEIIPFEVLWDLVKSDIGSNN
jgi:hypothetical protein